MKKNCLLLNVIMFFAFSSLHAASVSLTSAQTVAGNFFKTTFPGQVGHTSVTAVLKYTQTEPGGEVNFYVFDITPLNGFVAVAADNSITPVIAYSNESYFNSSFQKTPLVNWINKTAAQIHNTVLQHIQADATILNRWSAYAQGINPGSAKSTGVGPLLSTTWDQEPYYNEFCPINPADGQYSVTGCVATAMAQIMKYWNYPAQGTGSFSYIDDNAHGDQINAGTLSANFGATTYQWTQMPNYLTGNNTPVGTLMSHCGISVAMDYSDVGSGAWVIQSEANTAYGYSGAPCAENSYVTYFSYNPNTIQGVFQTNYTTTQWINLIEGEMNAGRVVQYEGFDPAAGGHTWVCDGYDVNNNLHMNWGWGGIDNGYFAVTNLSAGGYTFDYDDAALIGIEPLYPNADTTCTAAASFAYQSTGGSVIQFTNNSTSSHAFTSSWAFYNAQGQFATSNALSPLITFIGVSPYSAQLVIADTFYGGCYDTSTQAVIFNPHTTCLTLQQGSAFTQGADIASFHPNGNFDYSTFSDFMAEHWTNGGTPTTDMGLLQFDLSQIPTGSTIVSAQLSLYPDTASGNSYADEPTYGTANASYLQLLTSAWNAATVTWNTAPLYTTANEVLLAQSTATDEVYLNIDISNFTQTWVNTPASNYGLLLQMIGQNYYNSMIFCSPSYPDSTKRPRLDICYITPNQCNANASFIQQNLGAGQVRFTNTSTDNTSFTSSWTFYNSGGSFSTSNVANPVITFTGQPPYSAMLVITDSICSDTLTQIVSLINCITFQQGATHAVGSDIAAFHPTQNFDYTGYADFLAEHWTSSGTPTEDRGLLKYDLSQIPAGSLILSAKLSLYTDTNSGQGYVGQPTYGTNNASYLQMATSAWDPALVTWNTQPAIYTNNEILLAQSTSTNQDYLNIDISSFVQPWVNNPASNYGMLLDMITQNHYNSLIFCSPGYSDSTKWPRLDICYQLASPCHLLATFTQQNLGNGTVQFTSTSPSGNAALVWTFSNGSGSFAGSNVANPVVTFTGQPPFIALLQIIDTVTGCMDSSTQVVNIASCLTFQQGAKGGTGAAVTSLAAQASDNFNFASGFGELLAEQWTNGGVPIELRSLLQYDLTQIPVGTTLLNANLSFFADTANSNGHPGQPTYGLTNESYLNPITSAWSPATVTWNNQPSMGTTNQVLLAQSTTTEEDYLNINITALAQNWINNPSSNLGMMFRMVAQYYYNSLIFCSPGNADSTKRPLLQICYFTPAPPSGCALTDSFTSRSFGGDTVQFTNLSTSNQEFQSNWSFSNANGQFTTSTQTNPLVVYSGPMPYYATLSISDSSSLCIDSFSRQINVVSGINEPGNSNTGLSIFPNPNNGSSFYVHLPIGYDPQTTSIKAFDMLGREVQLAIIERQPEFCKLSIAESAATGIYTIILGYNSGQQCGKLVLVK